MQTTQISTYKSKLYNQRRQKHIQQKLQQLRQYSQHEQQHHQQYKQSSIHQLSNTTITCSSMISNNEYDCDRDRGNCEYSQRKGGKERGLDSQSTGISQYVYNSKQGVDRIRGYVFGLLWSMVQQQRYCNASITDSTSINYYQIYQQMYKFKIALQQQPIHIPDIGGKLTQQLTAYLIKLNHNIDQKPQQQPQQPQQQQKQYQHSQQQSQVNLKINIPNTSCNNIYLCYILCYMDMEQIVSLSAIKYRLVYIIGRIVDSGDQIFADLAYQLLYAVYSRQPSLLTNSIHKKNNPTHEQQYTNQSDLYYQAHHNRYLIQLLQQLPTKIPIYPPQLPTLLNTYNQIQYPQPIQILCEYQLLLLILQNIRVEVLVEYVNTGGLGILVEIDRKFVGVCLGRLGDSGGCQELLQAIWDRYGEFLRDDCQEQ